MTILNILNLYCVHTFSSSFSHWQLQTKSRFMSTLPNGVTNEKLFKKESISIRSYTSTNTFADYTDQGPLARKSR